MSQARGLTQGRRERVYGKHKLNVSKAMNLQFVLNTQGQKVQSNSEIIELSKLGLVEVVVDPARKNGKVGIFKMTQAGQDAVQELRDKGAI